MAKAPASDLIMPAGKMKPLLALSKKEPVQAAIGLSADGDGILLLDKKASPRKVMSMLRANADKAKLKLVGASLRFGRAEVDVDYDPGVVRLFINKEAPGAMRLKLTEVVKRIPYQKVEINVDPSLEEDGESDGSEAPPDQDAAPAPAPSPPPPPPPPPPRPVSPPQAAPVQAAPSPSSPPTPASLTLQLRELIGRIPQAAAADPARKAELIKLASEAGNDIKATRLDDAAEALGRLRAALDPQTNSKPPPAAPGAPNETAAWSAARQSWQDANDTVNDQINKLRAALLDRAKTGDEDSDIYAEALTDIAEKGLNAITEDHRVKLMAAVMELGDGAPAAIAKSGPKALGHIQAFKAFLDGSEKIEVCDANPFGAPVAIRATLGPALQQMAAVLQTATGG